MDLLSTEYVPNTPWGAKATMYEQNRSDLCPHGVFILVRETNNEYILSEIVSHICKCHSLLGSLSVPGNQARRKRRRKARGWIWSASLPFCGPSLRDGEVLRCVWADFRTRVLVCPSLGPSGKTACFPEKPGGWHYPLYPTRHWEENKIGWEKCLKDCMECPFYSIDSPWLSSGVWEI